MTTETAGPPKAGPPPATRSRGLAVLVGAAGAAVVLGGLLGLVGALTSGSPAAYAALAGTGFVVAILAFGSVAVDVVATVLPAASLLFAMLTYTLQVVLMALVFVALTRSGVLDDTLDREWFAGAIIAGTLCWLVAQIALATRVRIPVYDLPDPAPREGAGAAAEGSV
jgi:ATP synthase protein I